MPPHFHDPTLFYVELVYTAIILFLSLMIYFKTKEMYDLTKHKGIGFFRNTFLFFGLAYFFRFFLTAVDITQMTLDFHMRMFMVKPIVFALVSYMSTMAIFSLIFSTMWKDKKMDTLIILANLFAIVSAIATFLTRNSTILVFSQVILLIIGIILSYTNHHKKSKKFSNIFTIYILLFVFWIFNMALIGPPKPVPMEIRVIQNIISIVIFVIIFYKVYKWTK